MEEWPSLLDESVYATSRVRTVDEEVARIRRETSAFKLVVGGRGFPIGDEGVKAIAQELRDNNTCIGLDLSENIISNVGAHYLAEVLPHSGLKELFLSWNKISNDGMRALATTMRGSSLTALRIGYQNVDEIIDDGFVCIAESLKDTNLAVLDMSSNSRRVEESGVKALCDALPESRVLELRLQMVRVGLQHLLVVLPQTVITHLDLANNQLDDEFVLLLADALPHTRLKVLNLWWNKITAVGAGHLARVLPATKIWFLNIGWNKIGDAGLQSLCETLPNSSIRRLVLHVTSISDVGLKLLLDVGKPLIALDLSYNNSITDVGAQYIADFLTEEDINVELVNLRSNHNVTDEGGQALVEAMKKCRIVTEMNVRYTKISKAVGDEKLGRWVDVNRALKEKDREACALCLELNQMEVFRTGLPRLMIVRIAIFAVGGVETPDGELLYADEDYIMLFLSAQ